MSEKYAGRRAVFMVVERFNIFHSLEAPRADDKTRLSFQTEHLFIYVVNRTGGPFGKRWPAIANAAMTLTQALGDEISSMRDLTAREKTTRISKTKKQANDKTERLF